jgi:membrane peptidoglycan carboxypeptidase
MLADVITNFPGGAGPDYVPKNYDNKTRGPVQLRYALGNSLNIPSVKLLALVGVENMLQTATNMGLTTLQPTQENINRLGLSVTLGGGEVRLIDLISAYSSFANNGLKTEPVAILEVKDQKGKTLEKHKTLNGKRVLKKEEAYLINNILSDNNARQITFGLNSLLNISGRQVAVKTGTTDDMRDNWAIGWTPSKIVAVWVGNNDNTPMGKVASGISGASPIWRSIMLEALAKEPIEDFTMPANIVRKDVDIISGWPSHDEYPKREELFIKGTEPDGKDPIHTKLKVCKSDENKLAPDLLAAKGEYNEKEFIILKEEDPLSSSRNRWQEAIDAWIAGQDDQRYKYPTDYCQTSDEIVLSFEEPKNKKQVENEFDVKIDAVSDHGIENIKIYADNELKETLKSKPYQTKLVLTNGIHKIKVKAEDKKGNSKEAEITIGVNQDPEQEPSPSPSPLPSPTPSIPPSPSPSPSE